MFFQKLLIMPPSLCRGLSWFVSTTDLFLNHMKIFHLQDKEWAYKSRYAWG